MRQELIVVRASMEPLPLIKRKIGPFALIGWCRPTDVGIGIQIMRGGFLVSIWPVSIGIFHIATTVAGGAK